MKEGKRMDINLLFRIGLIASIPLWLFLIYKLSKLMAYVTVYILVEIIGVFYFIKKTSKKFNPLKSF